MGIILSMRGKEFGLDNTYISDYLKKYCHFSEEPFFAVLIKGEWGSGKTFFIQNFIKENKNIKFVYVSLFGLKNISEINEKLFEAFHPVLSSKHMKFFSSLFKGAMKLGVKINIEDYIDIDKLLDKELNKYIDFNVNEDKLIKNLFYTVKENIEKKDDKKDNKIVFIFDDLERCLIETKHLFSFINDFVEQKGLKVILIANEKEIKEKDKEDYDKFKEKVIGKEFEINLNFEDVYKDFLNLIENENEDVKRILEKNIFEIKDIFIKLEIKNLRILRQSFIEFNLFLKNINDDFLKNEEFVNNLIHQFFAFVFYYKKTNSLDEIKKLENFLEDKEKNQSIFKRRLGFTLFSIFFGIKFWQNFLIKGYVNIEDLNKEISKLSFFKTKFRPLWDILWHYWELDDNEFDEKLEQLKNKFFQCNSKEFENFYGLLHTVALLIFFRKKGVISFEDKEIEKKFLECIEKYKNSKFWKEKDFMLDFNPTGLGFMGENDPFFRKLLKIFKEKIEKVKENYELEIFETDKKRFLDLLKINDKLIFEFLKKYKFESFFDKFDDEEIKEILNLNAANLFTFNHILSSRYPDNYYYESKPIYCVYAKEKEFLNKLNEEIEKVDINNVSKLKKIALDNLISIIKKSIEKIENNCEK